MKIKFGNFRIHLYNPFVIFSLSILACLFVLSIERLAGLEWDFHPDANTYIANSVGTKSYPLKNYIGSLFYILVDLMNSKVWLVVTFNIFIYSITNIALANFFKRHTGLLSKQILVLFLLVIFNPYRTHLSVYVLKDTLIIFSMVYFFTSNRIYSWIFILLSYSLTNRTLIYLFTIINKKNLVIILLFMLVFISLQSQEFLYSVLSAKDQGDMTFRSFDKVPNFLEFGLLLGATIRAIVWPFLFLTGTFFLLSPTIMYLPIAVGSFFLQLWHFRQYGSLALYFQAYLVISILAFLVSGFTSFIRYALPVITIIPILALKNKKL